MPPLRLFLDANVLFTAAWSPSGKAAFLFDCTRGVSPSPWTLIGTRYVVEEARRNLELKRPEGLARLAELAALLEIGSQPAAPSTPLALPDKDVPVWAAALAARATHLLTGDLADFGVHMSRPVDTAGITIQTVAQFLAALD